MHLVYIERLKIAIPALGRQYVKNIDTILVDLVVQRISTDK